MTTTFVLRRVAFVPDARLLCKSHCDRNSSHRMNEHHQMQLIHVHMSFRWFCGCFVKLNLSANFSLRPFDFLLHIFTFLMHFRFHFFSIWLNHPRKNQFQKLKEILSQAIRISILRIMIHDQATQMRELTKYFLIHQIT